MKIIRIVNGYAYPSVLGGNVFAHTLSAELASRGYQCFIFSTVTGNEELAPNEVNGYFVKNYKPLFRIWSFPFTIKLVKDILKERPNIIHVHGYRSFHSELAAWLTVLKKIPFVMTPHGSLLGYKYLASSKLSKVIHILYDLLTFKFALRKAACITVTSNREASDALEIGVPQNKIRIMPHAEKLEIDMSLITPKPANRILSVGRVDPQQNWDTLIKSFALVLKQIPDAELILVGPSAYGHTQIDFSSGYRQELEELCNRLNITHKVKFTGRIIGEELKKIYVSSAVFMYVAPYGNYGRTHIEAATFGKPVISTAVGIVPDLVGDNEGGFLIKPYDIEEIAQAITSLLSDNSLYQAKQKAILERVKRFLDVKHMADEYEKLYSDLH